MNLNKIATYLIKRAYCSSKQQNFVKAAVSYGVGSVHNGGTGGGDSSEAGHRLASGVSTSKPLPPASTKPLMTAKQEAVAPIEATSLLRDAFLSSALAHPTQVGDNFQQGTDMRMEKIMSDLQAYRNSLALKGNPISDALFQVMVNRARKFALVLTGASMGAEVLTDLIPAAKAAKPVAAGARQAIRLGTKYGTKDLTRDLGVNAAFAAGDYYDTNTHPGNTAAPYNVQSKIDTAMAATEKKLQDYRSRMQAAGTPVSDDVMQRMWKANYDRISDYYIRLAQANNNGTSVSPR